MIRLFLGLTIFNLLCLSITSALGYGVMFAGARYASYHQLAGSLSAVCCCAVHCVVFTYFIATAKWVQHAIEVKQLDPSLVTPTRSFKAQAFPAAILAMAIVFVTAIVGVATFSYRIHPMWHHVMAWVSLLVNVGVAVVEYRAIARNGELIDSILRRINDPPPADAEHGSVADRPPERLRPDGSSSMPAPDRPRN
jgi:hypothetical protein